MIYLIFGMAMMRHGHGNHNYHGHHGSDEMEEVVGTVMGVIFLIRLMYDTSRAIPRLTVMTQPIKHDQFF